MYNKIKYREEEVTKQIKRTQSLSALEKECAEMLKESAKDKFIFIVIFLLYLIFLLFVIY